VINQAATWPAETNGHAMVAHRPSLAAGQIAATTRTSHLQRQTSARITSVDAAPTTGPALTASPRRGTTADRHDLRVRPMLWPRKQPVKSLRYPNSYYSSPPQPLESPLIGNTVIPQLVAAHPPARRQARPSNCPAFAGSGAGTLATPFDTRTRSPRRPGLEKAPDYPRPPATPAPSAAPRRNHHATDQTRRPAIPNPRRSADSATR
jgi:hypothetical protein